jgi:diguanylate cyclase (GGDEF)-like protein/PAS domain S-box-containing protein
MQLRQTLTLDSLFTQSPDAHLLIAPQSLQIIDANDVAITLFEVDSLAALRQLTREGLAATLPERQSDGTLSAEKLAAVAETVLQTGKARFTITHLSAKGNPFDIEVTAIRLPPTQSHPEGIIHAVWRDVTEKNHLLRQLTAAHEGFKRLFEDSSQATFLLANGQTLRANHAALTLLGVPDQKTLNGRTPLDFMDTHGNPETAGNIRQHVLAHTQKTGVYRFNWPIAPPGGAPFEAEIVTTLLENYLQTADGSYQNALHVTVRDISQVQRLLKTLQDAEQTFRKVFEEAASPLFIVSLDATTLAVNRAAVTLFGYDDAASMMGKTPLDMATAQQPDGRDPHTVGEEAVRLALEHGIYRFFWVMKTRQGQLLETEITLTRLDNYGATRATVLHAEVRDLTEQNRLLRSLQEETEKAQTTLASIGDAVIVTDTEGKITFMNNVACNLTGWAHQAAQGQPVQRVFNIINETTRAKVINPVEEVLTHGKAVNLANHTVLISQDGKEFPIEDSAAPIVLPTGERLGCVLVFHDVTDRYQIMKNMQWQANHDTLTGLPNRALLADRFNRAIAVAQRQKKLLAVCLIDLDNFKPINDTYGHHIGDQLLQTVAQNLAKALRGEDTIARLGGDEFVILLGDFDNTDQITIALTRIQRVLDAPYPIGDKSHPFSASIGVAVYPADDADSDTLLRHADQAMYQAKQAGRNRIAWFDAAHDKATQTAYRTLQRIEQGLAANEFQLFYQPKVDLNTAEILGFEALLRWFHPEQGMVPPMEFLPLAEEHALIIDIGAWVIEQALQQIRAWLALGKHWSVAVNIAPRHFGQPDFVDRLATLLKRFPDVPPTLLEIEILESVAMEDIIQVQQTITQCQALGVHFALDDFGTGFSSLSYLKKLPAETVKIDQSFVRDMLNDTDDLAMVQAIINLSHSFGRLTVAEGIETEEHGVMLMRLGCAIGQGYCIARPMPAAEVPIWAAQFAPKSTWLRWAESPNWSLEDFPLLMAERDHIDWVSQVIRVATGEGVLKLAPEEINNPRLCRFGQWYYGTGRAKYGELSAFTAIEPLHDEVHRLGAAILDRLSQGDQLAVEKKCARLVALKDQIVDKLHRLQEVILRLPGAAG